VVKKSSSFQVVLQPYNASTVIVFNPLYRDTATVPQPYYSHGTEQWPLKIHYYGRTTVKLKLCNRTKAIHRIMSEVRVTCSGNVSTVCVFIHKNGTAVAQS